MGRFNVGEIAIEPGQGLAENEMRNGVSGLTGILNRAFLPSRILPDDPDRPEECWPAGATAAALGNATPGLLQTLVNHHNFTPMPGADVSEVPKSRYLRPREMR